MERPNVAVDKKILVSEGSQRDSILFWRVWLGVPSMSHIGSPYVEKNITLVVSTVTRVQFDTI